MSSVVVPNSFWMVGIATFTMLVSRIDMNMPTISTASGMPHPPERRALPAESAGPVGGPGRGATAVCPPGGPPGRGPTPAPPALVGRAAVVAETREFERAMGRFLGRTGGTLGAR